VSMATDLHHLRGIAHKLLDDVLDYADAMAEDWKQDLVRKAVSPAQPVVSRSPLQTTPPKPSITLEPPAKKTPATKPMLHQYPDVTISCRRSCGALEIAVNLAAEIGQRLGLKPHGKATLDLHRGKLRVRRAEKVGRAVYSGGATGRLFFSVWADPYGVTEKHAPESCTFHFDLENELLIEPPAWLKKAGPASQKPKADPPATCTKLHGTNPTIKCAACKERAATLQCNLCPTLLCNACWDPHVRTHWHGKITSPAPTGRPADLER